MLVRFPSAFDAYNFGSMFLLQHYEEDYAIHSWDETAYTEKGYFDVGDSPSLQLSLHTGTFHPDGWRGMNNWAPEGTFVVTQEEAMSIGNTGMGKCNNATSFRESAFEEGTTRYRLVCCDKVKQAYDDIDFSDVD
jgi:hypothetical protein